MVPGCTHNPISELWNWLWGYVFKLFALSQRWQAYHNRQTRAVRINPQDKRKIGERCQQKMKAGSHRPQLHLWSWWVLKHPTHFSCYLPIISVKCVLVCIWIINILYSATLVSVCWPRVFSVTQHYQLNPSPVQSSYPVCPVQSSYPGCLHRRSPQIKCVWGPAWSAHTSPPGHSQMMTAASLQTHTTSCTIDGRGEGTKRRAIQLTSI